MPTHLSGGGRACRDAAPPFARVRNRLAPERPDGDGTHSPNRPDRMFSSLAVRYQWKLSAYMWHVKVHSYWTMMSKILSNYEYLRHPVASSLFLFRYHFFSSVVFLKRKRKPIEFKLVTIEVNHFNNFLDS